MRLTPHTHTYTYAHIQIIRKTIGFENSMMVDANQRWDVNEAIENMIQVSEFHVRGLSNDLISYEDIAIGIFVQCWKGYGSGFLNIKLSKNIVSYHYIPYHSSLSSSRCGLRSRRAPMMFSVMRRLPRYATSQRI